MINPINRRAFGKWVLKGGLLVPFSAPVMARAASILIPGPAISGAVFPGATLYVNTASTAGGDGTTNGTGGATRAFATLLEAVNSLPGTLTQPTRIFCDGSGGADTTAVNQAHFDFATSAANYLLITTQGGQRHAGVWDAGIYRLEVTNSNAIYNNLPSHVRIDGLQVKVTVSDAGNYIGIKTTNANQEEADVDCRVSNCIVRAVLTSGTLTGLHSRPPGVAGNALFWNNIVYDCGSGFSSDHADTFLYNNTIHSCAYGIVADAAFRALNNLVSTSTNVGFVGAFHAASNYNAEDDGNGAPGANSRSATTFTFVNAAADNFHLSGADAGARNFGVTNPGAGLFLDDIDGATRSGSWDIGADEV